MDLNALEYAVQDHLRPSEQLKYILPAHEAAGAMKDTDGASPSSASFRILIVVTNVDHDEEEGSIFVFRENDANFTSDHREFELQSIFPLTNILRLSIAQGRIRSGTLDLRPGKYVPPPPPSLLLTLETEEDKQVFLVESSDIMRAFVEDCRRLMKVANTASNLDFRWLGYYRPQRQLEIPLLFPRPDLRHLQKPPHEELSHAAAGQPGEEPADAYIIRDHWMRERLFQDKGVYVEERKINIRLGTFNVNGKTPSQDLSPWIRPQHKKPGRPELPPLRDISPISLSSFAASDYLSIEKLDISEEANGSVTGEEPDLLVLGFQELDLSTEALIYSYTTTREELWLASIFAGLGEIRDQYIKVASKQLVGMLIICIAKKDLVERISDVRTCAVGTGIMGMMGNKGASAIRLRLGSTVLSFVNSHLAAFDEYLDKRNADFQDLSRRLLFETPRTDDDEIRRDDAENAENVFQSDVVFWMVNLNYRINLSDTEVRQMIAGDANLNVRDMVAYDQLTQSRFKRKAFEDFKEGEIKYIPTYRFSAGVAADANGYDLKRRPAYTDRILYMHSPSVDIKQTIYTSHPEITMSDHRPVSANFNVGIWTADPASYYRRGRDLARRLGHVEEMEETPRLNIDISELSFGEVRYERPISKSFTLKNTGTVPCVFRLVALSEDDSTLPKWLTVNPQMGILLPEETLSLAAIINVDASSASRLNIGNERLKHTLILHTLWGKDYFVSVTGDYLPTCFANDIDILIRLPGPIRQLNLEENPLTSEAKTKTNAPREVIKLINWLMSNTADNHELFLRPGHAQLIEEIREALDTGADFDFTERKDADSNDLQHSVAHTLILFLQSLPKSLIPSQLHVRCAQVADRDEAFELLTALLPGSVLNVWISLTAFLHYIAQRISDEESQKRARAEQLACIFAPILLRDEATEDSPSRMTPMAKRHFLLHFVQ